MVGQVVSWDPFRPKVDAHATDWWKDTWQSPVLQCLAGYQPREDPVEKGAG